MNNNEINVRNEILDSINDLNQVTMESTLDVFGSMISAYEKADMIMEYSNTDDVSMFSIFQEAEVKEGDAKTNADAKKKDSFGYRLIHFIPNLIKKLIDAIKSAWTGVTTPKGTKPSSGFLALLEKCKGKTADWVESHGTELGIGGAALTLLAGFVAWSNSEKIKEILSKWFRGIKGFFVAVKAAPSIAFEGGSLITNIKKDGLIKSMNTLSDVLKRTNAITKDIAEKKKSVKDISEELKKIIATARDLQQNPDAFTGEEVTSSIDDFISLIEKVKDDMMDFSSLETVNIGDSSKPLFEDNNLEPSFIAETEKNCGILTKLVNAAAVAWAATSNAIKSLFTWIGEGLGIIKKCDEAIDSSAATVTMTDQSSTEPAEENEPLIENKEVDAAVVKVQEEPTEENIDAAVDAIEKSIEETPTNSDPKKIQVVTDMKKGAEQVRSYAKKNKNDSKRVAKKLARMARKAEKAAKVIKKADASPEELKQAEHEFRTAVREGSVGTEATLPSGEKVTRETQFRTYKFNTDRELLDFLNKNLGTGNNVQSASMKNGTLTLTNGKAVQGKKGYMMKKTSAVEGIGVKHGRIRLSNNGHAWILEFNEDAFDEFDMILESAIDMLLGYEDETFVVEYADGTTEEVSSLVMEAYEEESSEEDAAIEEINNHWYR